YTGDLLSVTTTRAKTSGATTVSDNGNIFDIAPAYSINAAGGTYNITGDLIKVSSTLTETLGTITDTRSLLSLTQNCGTNADCIGAVLSVTSAGAGNGADISLTNTSGIQSNGITVARNGAGGTTTNGIQIGTLAGTLTTGILIANYSGTMSNGIQLTGTFGTALLDTPSLDISAAGAITGATGVSTTTVTASSAIAANGGITFDQSTDTVGAFTMAGTLAMGANNITSTGSLGATGARLTAGFFTDLTVTNAIAGSVTGSSGSTTGNAGSATLTNLTDDTTTNATMFPTWVTTASGNQAQKVSSTKLTFNPSTGLLTSTGFSGPLTGNVTGNVSGSAATVTGAAQTAITSVGTLTSLTVAGTIAANGGITFDAATDTVGAFTAAGTINLNNNILTNIGNTGTDFIAATGALTLAGVLTANGGISIGTQALTGTTGIIDYSNFDVDASGNVTGTKFNKITITAPATGATLTIADGKTLTASNTLTFTGTDSSSVAFGTGGTVAYTANKLSVFAATTSAELKGV